MADPPAAPTLRRKETRTWTNESARALLETRAGGTSMSDRRDGGSGDAMTMMQVRL